MDYGKLNDRIEYMFEYETDNFLVNINLDDGIASKLYDYQQFHVFNLISALNNFNCVLDGSDTGTGKTYTTVAVCKHLRLKPLIICPKICRTNWESVCNYYDLEPLDILNYEKVKFGKTAYIDEEMRWHLPKSSIIVFDEVHRCRSATTQNGKLLLSAKGKRIMLLSATLSDTPKSFRVFGYMLGFYNDLRRARNWINGCLREDANYIGEKVRLSSINKKIYPERGSRMCIKDLGDKFPANQIVAEAYKIKKKHEDEFNKAFQIVDSKIKSVGGDQLVLKEIMAAREKIEMFKTGIFVDLAKQYLENGLSVVIFVNFTKTLRLLAEQLNTRCVLHGKLSEARKEHNIAAFQSNEQRVIICNIKMGKESISLHDLHGVQRVSLISPTWSSLDLQQILGRISRVGSKTPALQRIIFVSNTCEEAICERVKYKLKFLSKLNDDDLILI